MLRFGVKKRLPICLRKDVTTTVEKALMIGAMTGGLGNVLQTSSDIQA